MKESVIYQEILQEGEAKGKAEGKAEGIAQEKLKILVKLRQICFKPVFLSI